MGLKWNQADLEEGRAWLLPGETKNKEGREIFLDADILTQLKILKAKRNPLCPYVFQNDGHRIKDFRGAWDAALRRCGFIPQFKCKACGALTELPKGTRRKNLRCFRCGGDKLRREGKIFHDLRRTSARDDVRAGIPEGVVMKRGGWKTRRIFDRYNIIDDKDLRKATEQRHLFFQVQNGRGDNRGDSHPDFPLETVVENNATQ